jgi:hypothetical protein
MNLSHSDRGYLPSGLEDELCPVRFAPGDALVVEGDERPETALPHTPQYPDTVVPHSECGLLHRISNRATESLQPRYGNPKSTAMWRRDARERRTCVHGFGAAGGRACAGRGRMGEAAAKGAGYAASLFGSGKAAAHSSHRRQIATTWWQSTRRRTWAVNECALMDVITARLLETCMT